MSRNAQTWKFRRTLLHNEEPCRAQTLQNVKFLEGLTYDKSRTSQRFIFVFVLENDDVKIFVLAVDEQCQSALPKILQF